MFLKKYLPKNKISREDKREYKSFLFSRGYLRGAKLFCFHVIYIIINYMKFSKEQKAKSYIHVYYNAADYPILTIDF